MTKNSSRPSQTTPLQDLQTLVRDLDLTTLAENLPGFLEKAEQNNLAYTDFAMGLFQAEVVARRARRTERNLKRSKLTSIEDLETFNFAVRPKLEARIIKELCNCQFVEERRNILCLGRPGLGKTRIAKIIAHSACLAGYSVLFVKTASMLEDLHASLADGSGSRAMSRYTKPQLLVCDEFGYETFDPKATKYLFRLISARHKQGSIILTSNTGFTRWKTLFPSEAAAVATVDRLVDQATILRFTGQGYRQPKDFHGESLEDD
ncbi:MAG: IstB-like protein ATP-binding protein [uncultured bacterium]|nr:MAG: IstB-like protein ATP-binding protein [uncultured bacterium]